MHLLPNEADPKLLARLERLEPFALAITAVISGARLLHAVVPAFARHAAYWPNMYPATAVTLLFATAALGLSNARWPRPAQNVATGIALGLVLSTIAGLVGHVGLLPAPAWRIALLPSVPTIIASLLGFLGLLWNRRSDGVQSIFADVGAIVAIAFLLFLIGGFVFESIDIMGVGRVPLQSPPTVVAIGLIAAVLGSRRAIAGGAFGFIVTGDVGSRIARAVLPAIVALPFVIFQGINLLDRAGISPIVHSQALAAPLLVMATVAIVVWMARYTNWIERQLRQQSLTDQLTGVLNRRGFETASAHLTRSALRDGHGAIAFFFDLDNLKRANDVLGHTAGSQVIQRFADLLSVSFRKTDIIGRVGGDEFVVLSPAPIESAADILTRFARVVAELNASEYIPVPISYSVGYAETPPGGAGDVEALIAEADARMYAEKSRKRAA